MRYDRARKNLDRHPGYVLVAHGIRTTALTALSRR
jgi:hypothetical protein